jgi:hypothetical protein
MFVDLGFGGHGANHIPLAYQLRGKARDAKALGGRAAQTQRGPAVLNNGRYLFEQRQLLSCRRYDRRCDRSGAGAMLHAGTQSTVR